MFTYVYIFTIPFICLRIPLTNLFVSVTAWCRLSQKQPTITLIQYNNVMVAPLAFNV